MESIPPVKQTPADVAERERQATWRAALHDAVAVQHPTLWTVRRPNRLELTLTYERGRGRSDPANIIGGVADQLERAGAYENDFQLRTIHYTEQDARDGRNRYRVALTIEA